MKTQWNRLTTAAVVIGTMAACAGTWAANPPAPDDKPLAIKVGILHIGDGRIVTGALVLIEKGKVTGAGANIAIPGGATVIDVPHASITPGLIDANAAVEANDTVSTVRPRPSALAMMFAEPNHKPGDSCWACSPPPPCAFATLHENLEQGQICPCCGYPTAQNIDDMISGVDRSRSETEGSSEVVPHTRAADSINLRSPDFARLARAGVTTVFVSPDSSAVIGPKGAIVRTAGPLADRIVEPEAAVKATFGSDAYRVGAGNAPPFPGFVTTRTRRPNTRMGVAWVFRKAFYDAERFAKGETPGGADSPPSEALPALTDIRAGKTGLRAQARTQPDILTALRLCKELGLKMTLLEGTEAYKCLDELRSTGTPVIYGPIYDTPSGLRSFTNEAEYSRLSTLRELIEAGIPTALSAQDLREEDGLARQAMYAVRAGLTPEKALEAVTLTPAKLLGIDKETGTLEAGKRADLVVWSGEPLEATSRPLLVVIGGRVVYDAREKDGAK